MREECERGERERERAAKKQKVAQEWKLYRFFVFSENTVRGVREAVVSVGQKRNLIFENGQFSGHFVLDKNNFF